MALATPEDVQKRLGRPLTAPEAEQVAEWVEDLEADIRERIADLDDRLLVASYARTVKRVIAETVVVKVRNPEGLRQFTSSIDDYSVTKTVDKANSAGRLEISEEDWAKLLPATAGDAFTIRVGGIRP